MVLLTRSCRAYFWQATHEHRDEMCSLCGIPEKGSTSFSCVPLTALFGILSTRLQGWQAPDHGEFLEAWQNLTLRRRCLFWLVFEAMIWTLWTIRNKLVIKRVFLWSGTDNVYKFLTNLSSCTYYVDRAAQKTCFILFQRKHVFSHRLAIEIRSFLKVYCPFFSSWPCLWCCLNRLYLLFACTLTSCMDMVDFIYLFIKRREN